jgi:archaellum component FlaG (FlaF/FlaG flagellin family)
MSKLSSYVNELLSFVVMLLLLAALISGQLNAQAAKLASVDSQAAEISHIRLEGE